MALRELGPRVVGADPRDIRPITADGRARGDAGRAGASELSVGVRPPSERLALRDCLCVHRTDFVASLRRIKSSVSREYLRDLEQWNREHGST